MSAVPRPDPASDPGLSGVAAMLADLTAQLKQLNDIAEKRSAAGLSAAELRVAENVKPSAPCILEEDAELRFGGRFFSMTLRAYGRWDRDAMRYGLDSVTVSTGPDALEVCIYNALNDEALEVVGDAAYEADPQ